MPKIDWRDDDQPRWERLRHMRRIYQPRSPLSGTSSFMVPIISARSSEPTGPVRKPLHLIWGEPAPRQDGTSRSEPSP
jgi:hypothetical protein